jgi:ribosomal protein S12 methylthiotransferase
MHEKANRVGSEALSRVALVSLGCSKNTVDSEVLLAKLDLSGFTLTRHAEEAQVLIVNTCGFIDAAKQESIETILELAEHKHAGSCKKLVVIGCLSQRYQSQLKKALPEVDAFFGTEQQGRVVEFLLRGSGRAPRRPAAAVTDLRDEAPPRLRISDGPSAYLKISEGCNHACTFCVIPSIRGRHVSRPIESLVAEARSLARRGVRELAVISQDTAYYGVDLGLRRGLETLLDRLCEIEGIEWIRLHYLYPASIREDLVDRLVRQPKLVPYLDMPVQHGVDHLLRRMRRPDTRRSLETLVLDLRRAVPDVSLRTTVIVGFPGETEEHFAELLDFVEECRFDHLGVFTYSDEEGTGAWALDSKVPPDVANERQERLLALQQEISRERLERFRGRSQRVLIEGRSADGLAVGRTAHQAPEVDGVTYIKGSSPRGEFVLARIERTLDYDLVAISLQGRSTESTDLEAGPVRPDLIPAEQLNSARWSEGVPGVPRCGS